METKQTCSSWLQGSHQRDARGAGLGRDLWQSDNPLLIAMGFPVWRKLPHLPSLESSFPPQSSEALLLYGLWLYQTLPAKLTNNQTTPEMQLCQILRLNWVNFQFHTWRQSHSQLNCSVQGCKAELQTTATRLWAPQGSDLKSNWDNKLGFQSHKLCYWQGSIL